jgi:hypothetical protein
MFLGLTLALASALATNLSFLLKQRGAVLAAPIHVRHPLMLAFLLVIAGAAMIPAPLALLSGPASRSRRHGDLFLSCLHSSPYKPG